MSFSLFMQSKGKHAFYLLGKSAFIINERGFSSKLDMFYKKVIMHQWNDLDEIRIKLFEVQVKVKQQLESINLEKLGDDNLKNVKEIFSDFQSKFKKETELTA